MQMYDQRALLARLEPLDRGAKTAFASTSAQRLLPLFGRYARVAGVPAHTQRLAGILAAAWDVSSGRVIDVRSMDSEVESMAHPNVDVTDAMVVGVRDCAGSFVSHGGVPRCRCVDATFLA
jgi:hypothetical protein